MSRIKGKDTRPEQITGELLKSLGVKYKKNVKELPGCPDFIVPKHSVVIFVNGCYWHGHMNCKRATLPNTNNRFWKDKILGNRRRDIRNARKLRSMGWRVITIWQCRMKKLERLQKRLSRYF